MKQSELKDKIEKIVREKLTEKEDRSKSEQKTVPLEASGRHVHLCQNDIDKLFGKNYRLTPKKELSQPGQFLAQEKLKLIGPKKVINNVAILGPARDSTQVELSKTDAVSLGVAAPLRLSGNTEDSASLFIASEDNVVQLEEGVIIARRHIHMTPADAIRLDLSDKELVNVEAITERPVIFKDVLVRVNEDYNLNMHLDYDEANACLLKKGDRGKIIKTGKIADD